MHKHREVSADRLTTMDFIVNVGRVKATHSVGMFRVVLVEKVCPQLSTGRIILSEREEVYHMTEMVAIRAAVRSG